MQTMEFAGMDALLWVSMFIGMYIAYILVVKLKFKEVVKKKGEMKFAPEYLYTFLAISAVFAGMLVPVVDWIGGIGYSGLFLDATLGNCALVAMLAGTFVIIFQDQVRVKIDMYLKEKKSVVEIGADIMDNVKEIEAGKKGL